jgi:geranylgeranyl diphosphate synthase type I
MSDEQNPVLQARKLLYQHGQRGLERAQELMLKEKIPHEPLQDAVEFFMGYWEDVVHPALLSLACEAVDGKTQITVDMGAAFVLLAGAADLHDDIIDGSTQKDSKPTVYGKFGKDLTVLAGEVLMFKGLYALHEGCQNLSKDQRSIILEVTKDAFLEISGAEAKEANMHGRTDCADEYFDMVKMKAAVSEATMRVGAILGGASPGQVEVLGHFGRTFGVLFTLRDEIIDTFELAEIKNRFERECLPLPILLTMKNADKSVLLAEQLAKPLTEDIVENILRLVSDSEHTVALESEMRLMVQDENGRLQSAGLYSEAFDVLLRAMIEDL